MYVMYGDRIDLLKSVPIQQNKCRECHAELSMGWMDPRVGSGHVDNSGAMHVQAAISMPSNTSPQSIARMRSL